MSEDIDISPTDCSDVWGAKYCVKHVGRFEGKNYHQKEHTKIQINVSLFS